jgi:hypothetical protein
MPRALIGNRTNTGLLEITNKSPDNRSKTRRLEGGGDFPLIFIFTRRLANSLLLRSTFSLFVLLTARKEQAKRNADITSDAIGYN